MGDSVASGKAGNPQAVREASWKRYIKRSAAGDQSALASLYDQSSAMVHSVALRVLGDSADADEVTLDVYTQVWRSAASYDQSRGSVTAWLVMLARSRALDRLRSRAGRMKHEVPVVEFFEVQSSAASPERETEYNQKRRRVQAALDTLPSEQREVVQLAFFSGLTHTELADHLQQPLGTVKTRIRTGMMKLREQLEPFAYG